MANNIMNQIHMKGIAELPYFTEEKNQYTGEMEKGFDFNKIIPMPEELMLTQGGYEEECIRAALSEINTVIQNEGRLFNVKHTINIKEDWVRKCYYEAHKDNTLVVLLIPARTDTTYFQDYILYRAEIRFIRGRLKFGESKDAAPFPSMLAIFRAPGM